MLEQRCLRISITEIPEGNAFKIITQVRIKTPCAIASGHKKNALQRCFYFFGFSILFYRAHPRLLVSYSKGVIFL